MEVLQASLAEQESFEEPVGRGAYSVFFRVINRSLARTEALKAFIRVLDEEATARFFAKPAWRPAWITQTSSRSSTLAKHGGSPGTPCSWWTGPPWRSS